MAEQREVGTRYIDAQRSTPKAHERHQWPEDDAPPAMDSVDSLRLIPRHHQPDTQSS
jgi:hypothetical protein